MTESNIGLHIYRVEQKYAGNIIELSSSGEGARLKNCCPSFFQRHSQQTDGGNENRRAWYLEPRNLNSVDTYHGLIQYGTFGYSEVIRDKETRALKYNRLSTDIGTIPLYYRLWVPDNGRNALCALQTFGSRSCVIRFQKAFINYYRSGDDRFNLNFEPVVPIELASLGEAEVKSFSLIKHDYSSDAAENQFDRSGGRVDLNVSFKAKRKKNLGILSSLRSRIGRNERRNVLKYNNTEFDEATVEIMMRGKRRKITVIGASQNSGKFDLTEYVRIRSGHPVFESIAQEVADLFLDIVRGDT